MADSELFPRRRVTPQLMVFHHPESGNYNVFGPGAPMEGEEPVENEAPGGGGGGDDDPNDSDDDSPDNGAPGGGQADIPEDEEEASHIIDWFNGYFDIDTLLAGPGTFQPRELDMLLTIPGLELPEDTIYSIRMASWQINERCSVAAYNRLRKALLPKVKLAPLPQVARVMQTITGCRAIKFDCCPKSHVLYTGRYARSVRCPARGCKERRFQDFDPDDEESQTEYPEDSDHETLEEPDLPPFLKRGTNVPRRPRKSALYMPLIPVLLHWMRDPVRSKLMQHHVTAHLHKLDRRVELERLQETEELEESEKKELEQLRIVCDIWDADLMNKYLRDKLNIFKDVRDFAFAIGWDSAPVVDEPNVHSITPLLVMVLNLPPELRARKENLLCPLIMPGPHAPTDFTTWMRPFRREMLLLDKGIPDAVDGMSAARLISKAQMALPVNQQPLHLVQFRMRGWSVLGMADQVAMNSMIQMKGHSSK